MRVTILYSPCGSGHRTAARAVADALQQHQDVRVDVIDVLRFAPKAFRYDLVWQQIQQRGGWMWDRLFDLSDRPHPTWRAVRERINVHLFAPLARELERLQPDRVVCTHFLPAVALAYLRRTRRISARTATIVTDYLAHEAWLCPGIDRYYGPTPATPRASSCSATLGVGT
jgi:processive 1,2-diacylglycerol beta-glucosyltransferase